MSAGRALRWLLALQLAFGAVLFGGDMWESLETAALTPAVPRLTEVVRPGDQTRRYAPRRLPLRDDPGDTRPFPLPGEMPERLSFAPAEVDGEAALGLTGQIAPGDAERLADYLDGLLTPPVTVWLNSPGGSVTDALAIGRLIRAEGMATALGRGDLCLSACPYVLVGGTSRRVAEGALVGVHQHYFGENAALPAFLAVEDIQRGQGEVMVYLDEMGIDPLIMRHALVTPPDEIYILVPDELRRYGVLDGDSGAPEGT